MNRYIGGFPPTRVVGFANRIYDEHGDVIFVGTMSDQVFLCLPDWSGCATTEGNPSHHLFLGTPMTPEDGRPEAAKPGWDPPAYLRGLGRNSRTEVLEDLARI